MTPPSSRRSLRALPHPRLDRRALLLAPLALGLVPVAAQVAPRSASATSPHARARLIDGGRRSDGARLAAIELALDHGFKTYWRNPGEAGLPPAFDWSGSENLASAEVLWPAPQRLEDAGGVAYGWKDRALWPVRVTPAAPGRPVALALALAYGICRETCIPVRANLGLDLPSDVTGTPLGPALAALPAPTPLGAAGDLAIIAVEPPAGDPPSLAVRVRAPDGTSLFAEAPEGWFLLPEAAARPCEAGTRTFATALLERPSGDAGPLALTLTLVAPDGRAIETPVSLDTRGWPR